MDDIKNINYKLPQIEELEKLILLIGFTPAPNVFSISFNDEPILMSDNTQYCYFFNKWRIIIEYAHVNDSSNRLDFELAGLHTDDVYSVIQSFYFSNCVDNDIDYFNNLANSFKENCRNVLYRIFKKELRKNKIKKLLS